MTTRILLAGILGGLAIFVWGFIAHIFLPLGETGVAEIPNEPNVTAALQSNIGEKSGLYIFPGFGLGPDATRQQKREAMKQIADKLQTNPSGLLIYHPPASRRPFGASLGIEFATNVVESIVVVFLLAIVKIETFGGRVGFAAVGGILAAMTTNVPYWNWYGFPTNYTISYMTIQIIGFICVGVVAGLLLRKRLPQATWLELGT